MLSTENTESFAFDRPGKYRIRALGSLDESWADRLGGLRIIRKENQKERMTELIGMVRDQAELSGILETLYEQHLTLVSVEMLEG